MITVVFSLVSGFWLLAAAPAEIPYQSLVIAPDLSMFKSHAGNFIVEQEGTYSLAVVNVGTGPTTGAIAVADTLPVGMTYVSSSVGGWICKVDPGILIIGQPQRVTCTNPGPFAPSAGSRFSLTVRVAPVTTPSSVTVINTATVSTPGDLNPANNTAKDPTVVLPGPGPYYTLEVPIAGNGRVSSNPPGIDCPVARCSAEYASGTVVTLRAQPAWGWVFEGWSEEGCSGTGLCQVVMTQPRRVAASFVRYNLRPRIILLVRAAADDTVDYFRELLDACKAPYRELLAEQVPAANLGNSVIIAGFSSEPREFEGVADRIRNAVLNGSWMIADGFGEYVLSYAKIGTASPSSYSPAVAEEYAYVRNIDKSPLFALIPRYDPPEPPDRPEQYIDYVAEPGSFEAVDYTPPSCGVRYVKYWSLVHTPGWPHLPTDSGYCLRWGGCTPERSVGVRSIPWIHCGLGRIFVGLTATGVIKGYHEYGPVMRRFHRNFIAWKLLQRWCDFDGDGKTDIAVWRPATGMWYALQSSSLADAASSQWGVQADMPVPGDFDGDGAIDVAVWRPGSGIWYILPSSAPGEFINVQWGMAGDIPVPGDYDGDGMTDVAVWRPSTGTWYILPSGAPGEFISRQWGVSGDIPVPGDYDGDRAADMAVWRPGSGTWYILPSSAPGEFVSAHWGVSGDTPVPGDYDGDGITDMAAWRPGSGTWYVLPSGAPAEPTVVQWGLPTDIVVPADYDGDGKTDMAVWRPGCGTWYVLPSSAPEGFTAAQWGMSGDMPLSAITRTLRAIP